MTYQPDAAFAALFAGFTGGHAHSIGTQLSARMRALGAGEPLLVSTASDVILFPGDGAAPVVQSFRVHTRGFIELTAVSHLPLAICYVARMRELAPADEGWRDQLQTLMAQARAVQAANTEVMWREQVALRAFAGAETKLTALVAYALQTCLDYMQQALAEPSRLDFDQLRERFIDAGPEHLRVNMNTVMFATFGLAYVDIAYRVSQWLGALPVDWTRMAVLVSGQSGRPTAGVTWSSNNMCNLIWAASGHRLPPDRLFVAPHAPAFSAAKMPDAAGLQALETTYRHLWCHTRASVDLAQRMFSGYQAFSFEPAQARDMPPIRSLDDHDACVARLRRIMEDPQQLLSNCVADHIVDELQRHGGRPECVAIPGFTNVDY